MFNATLFYNTGFNAVNTPDSPETLNKEFAAGAKEFPALDILQLMPLSSISVKITSEEDVIDADYLMLSGKTEGAIYEKQAYYSIEGYTLTSPDVAVLSITLNPFLTLGGVAGIHFLDGITVRHHVPKAADVFGAYTEEDPYLIPSKPLEIVNGGELYKASGTEYTFVESTIDLDRFSQESKATAYIATDEDSKCVVPDVPSISRTHVNATGAMVIMFKIPGQISDNNYYSTTVPGAGYYTTKSERVLKGLDKARALSVEGGILNQWTIDSTYLNMNGCIVGAGTQLADYAGGDTNGEIFQLYGGGPVGSVAAKVPFKYSNVHNERVLYGSLNKYVLISFASGNSGEFLPEDIKEEDLDAPVVLMNSDPRPDGKPYYRFREYKGNRENFFLNCVPGLVWQTAPLVYSNKSGSELDAVRYRTATSIAIDDTIVNQKRAIKDAVMSGANQIASGLGSAAGGLLFNSVSNIIGGALTAASGAANIAMEVGGNMANNAVLSNAANIRRQFENIRNAELQEFAIQQKIVEPQIYFPRSNSIRDFVGNGVFIYRYRPSDTDVKKLDKILTMYGYRDTAPAEDSFLSNRAKFNYIQVSGASINAKGAETRPKPKWLKDACVAQFAAGVRVWHTKPDTAVYTDGTNV